MQIVIIDDDKVQLDLISEILEESFEDHDVEHFELITINDIKSESDIDSIIDRYKGADIILSDNFYEGIGEIGEKILLGFYEVNSNASLFLLTGDSFALEFIDTKGRFEVLDKARVLEEDMLFNKIVEANIIKGNR